MNTLVLLFLFHTFMAIHQVKGQNPFLGTTLYVNPNYVAEVQATINSNPTLTSLLEPHQQISTAYWIDRMAKIPTLSPILADALHKQTTSGTPVLTVFVIYDLPNRDCSAAASNGEILCADSNCTAGLNTYEHDYIDPIVTIFANYSTQPIVALIEPDSLPNLATNLGVAKCQEAQTAYKAGIAYAINRLSTLSNVHLYVDAAHGGWLGWASNMASFTTIISDVLTMAGGQQLIRGFATNTANYQPLGTATSTADPCNLQSQYNFAINEVLYIKLLNTSLASAGITNKGYITDTSRNGIINERQSCSNWCNIKGSAFGVNPSTDTSGSGIDIIDAYYWVKVPGEADGTSNTSSPRYDYHCTSVDSFIPAPEAGNWFAAFFIMLANNGVAIANASTVSTGINSDSSGSVATGSTTSSSSSSSSSGSGSSSGSSSGLGANTGSGSSSSSVSGSGASSSSHAASGSGSTTGSAVCNVGAQGCDCTVGGACDEGLKCILQVCVNGASTLNPRWTMVLVFTLFGLVALI